MCRQKTHTHHVSVQYNMIFISHMANVWITLIVVHVFANFFPRLFCLFFFPLLTMRIWLNQMAYSGDARLLIDRFVCEHRINSIEHFFALYQQFATCVFSTFLNNCVTMHVHRNTWKYFTFAQITATYLHYEILLGSCVPPPPNPFSTRKVSRRIGKIAYFCRCWQCSSKLMQSDSNCDFVSLLTVFIHNCLLVIYLLVYTYFPRSLCVFFFFFLLISRYTKCININSILKWFNRIKGSQ